MIVNKTRRRVKHLLSNKSYKNSKNNLLKGSTHNFDADYSFIDFNNSNMADAQDIHKLDQKPSKKTKKKSLFTNAFKVEQNQQSRKIGQNHKTKKLNLKNILSGNKSNTKQNNIKRSNDIDVISNVIANIPNSVFDLNLSGNNLKSNELDDIINNLVKSNQEKDIKILNISNNNLTSLPSSLESLASLEDIVMDNNINLSDIDVLTKLSIKKVSLKNTSVTQVNGSQQKWSPIVQQKITLVTDSNKSKNVSSKSVIKSVDYFIDTCSVLDTVKKNIASGIYKNKKSSRKQNSPVNKQINWDKSQIDYYDSMIPMLNIDLVDNKRGITQYSYNNYKLVLSKTIGSGSNGRIYEAELFDSNSKKARQIAIKTIHTNDIREFFLETIIQNELYCNLRDDKNVTFIGIPEIVFIGKFKDARYGHTVYMLGMEKLEGDGNKYLKEISAIKTFGRRCRFELLFMLQQIAKVLMQLQDKFMFMHRDLHLGNIMYKKENGMYIWYVMDFGMSTISYDMKNNIFINMITDGVYKHNHIFNHTHDLRMLCVSIYTRFYQYSYKPYLLDFFMIMLPIMKNLQYIEHINDKRYYKNGTYKKIPIFWNFYNAENAKQHNPNITFDAISTVDEYFNPGYINKYIEKYSNTDTITERLKTIADFTWLYRQYEPYSKYYVSNTKNQSHKNYTHINILLIINADVQLTLNSIKIS